MTVCIPLTNALMHVHDASESLWTAKFRSSHIPHAAPMIITVTPSWDQADMNQVTQKIKVQTLPEKMSRSENATIRSLLYRL